MYSHTDLRQSDKQKCACVAHASFRNVYELFSYYSPVKCNGNDCDYDHTSRSGSVVLCVFVFLVFKSLQQIYVALMGPECFSYIAL